MLRVVIKRVMIAIDIFILLIIQEEIYIINLIYSMKSVNIILHYLLPFIQ